MDFSSRLYLSRIKAADSLPVGAGYTVGFFSLLPELPVKGSPRNAFKAGDLCVCVCVCVKKSSNLRCSEGSGDGYREPHSLTVSTHLLGGLTDMAGVGAMSHR